LSRGYSYINDYAKEQHLNYSFYGNNLLDISKFDTDRPRHIEEFHTNPDIQLTINKDEFLKTLPACISNMLLMKHLGFKRRGYVICYFRDMGYYMSETIQILEKYLERGEFIHCTTRRIAPGHNVAGEEQVQYFYKPYIKERINFPGCWRLKSWGECPIQGECEAGKKIYKK